MRTTLFTFIATVLVASTLTFGSAGSAGAAGIPHSRGVKSVNYQETTDSCAFGFSFLCTPNAGVGSANVLRVDQKATPGGGHAFAGYTTTSTHPDRVWMAATLGSECRAGYHHDRARIGAGWKYDAYMTNGSEPQVDLDAQAQQWFTNISVPAAKVMPAKKLALNIPLDKLFSADDGNSMVSDFDSLSDIYAHGEAMVQLMISGGKSEAQARSTPFTFQTWVATHAHVACVGNTQVGNRMFHKRMPRYLPLTIEYKALPAPGASGQAAPGAGWVPQAQVAQAALAIVPDPNDDCVMHLSGTLVADRSTAATYRFIDPYGRTSPSYTTQLTDDLPTFVNHTIAIPTQGAKPSSGGLDQEAGGPITTNLSGTIRLEVTSPNVIRSPHVGFNVAPCSRGTVDPNHQPATGLSGGSTPTHGGSRPGGVTAPTTTAPPTTAPVRVPGAVATPTTSTVPSPTTTTPAPTTGGRPGGLALR